MIEGRGGESESMNPAALDHEHHKAHHIGKAFASAHGRSHEGGLGGGKHPSSASADSVTSGVNGAGNDASFDHSEQ